MGECRIFLNKGICQHIFYYHLQRHNNCSISAYIQGILKFFRMDVSGDSTGLVGDRGESCKRGNKGKHAERERKV